MKKRIVFGSLMIIGVVGLFTLDWWVSSLGFALGGLVLTLLATALIAFSLRELSGLLTHAGLSLLGASALVGAIAIADWPYYSRLAIPHLPSVLAAFFLLAAVILLVFAEQMIRFRIQHAIPHIAGTFLAVLYLGVGAAIIVGIRLHFGILPLVLFLVAVKFTDIGAYFTGSAIGKHKMIPWLSPGKTWEGLVGGLAAAAGMSMLVVAVCRAANLNGLMPLGSLHELTYGKAAAFGVIVGLAGQFGDLCESLLKRSAGAKDSGAVVPEFGGLLDILDSPLLAAPVAYILLMLLT